MTSHGMTRHDMMKEGRKGWPGARRLAVDRKQKKPRTLRALVEVRRGGAGRSRRRALLVLRGQTPTLTTADHARYSPWTGSTKESYSSTMSN